MKNPPHSFFSEMTYYVLSRMLSLTNQQLLTTYVWLSLYTWLTYHLHNSKKGSNQHKICYRKLEEYSHKHPIKRNEHQNKSYQDRLPNPENPGISRLTCERSTSFADEAGTDSEAPSICSGDTSESDSSLASGQSSNAGIPGFLPDEISLTQGFSVSSCSDASNALRVSSFKHQMHLTNDN